MGRFKVIFIVVTLIILTSILRFTYLGYSELQDDEKKAIITPRYNGSNISFLLNQRKGPMQFVVTSLTLMFTKDRTNELGLRIPFAVASVISVVVFYFLLKELTNSNVASLVGSLIFLSNGFMVGFGRIAQYQNLNILFSLLSILMFAYLVKTGKHYYLYSVLSILFFSLSFLSHWDAIFALVPIMFFLVKFWRRKEVDKKTKIKVATYALLVGSILILPFLIPYINVQLNNSANITYFERRVGFSTYDLAKHLAIFKLYNPFITLYFVGFLALLSFIKFKQSVIIFLWFLVNSLAIRYFMQKPGTHIYNYVVPAIVLASLGISYVQQYSKILNRIILPPVFLGCLFLYWQAYTLFVDHTVEYPWESKTVFQINKFKLEAPKYENKEILTFGFPHFRNWKEVANIINNDSPDCKYLTNEGKSISQSYLPNNYGRNPKPLCQYIVYIKRPFVIEGTDAVFAETHKRTPLYEFKKGDEAVLQLYKIR